MWAIAKPCQIVPLATVVASSPTSPTAFKSLARLPEFVNAVLNVKPSWLPSLPDKTGTNVIGNSSSDRLLDCVDLVSSCTLSHGALLASNRQRLLEAATNVIALRDETSLRRFSELCYAFSGNILDVFTDESLMGLSSWCKGVCSGSIGIRSDIEIMLAQDILAQVAVAFHNPKTPSRCSLETPPGAKFSEACRKRVFKLFSDASATTLLKMTVLRLSMFCSKQRGSSSHVALEGIRLAQRIIAPILASTRQTWVEENLTIVEKLISRLGREGLDLSRRLEVRAGLRHLGFRSDG